LFAGSNFKFIVSIIFQMNSYTHYEDFHSDMLLVRDNCRTYNPPGSVVRRDCDEVFAFYMSEYEKLLEKWQKVMYYVHVFTMIEIYSS
jgi:hypothetical protein